MTEPLLQCAQKEKNTKNKIKQTAAKQRKELIMKKVIEKIKKLFAEMRCAYKEAAPYMNIHNYECSNLQIAF